MDSNYVKSAQAGVAVNTLIRRVYLWMSIALGITGLTAWVVAGSSWAINLMYGNTFVFWGLLIAQLVLVFTISGAVRKLSFGTMYMLYILYSFLTGVTFSFIFLLYTKSSIASTFLVTAGIFAVMSLYGYITKKDLTSWGNIMLMALVGVILASVVNFFLKSEMLYWIVTYVGVFVFVGLIAYDTQKLKALAGMEENESTSKLALMGALSLYLDFINLFLMLLRIMGRQK